MNVFPDPMYPIYDTCPYSSQAGFMSSQTQSRILKDNAECRLLVRYAAWLLYVLIVRTDVPSIRRVLEEPYRVPSNLTYFMAKVSRISFNPKKAN
jgi:hypothetical protein